MAYVTRLDVKAYLHIEAVSEDSLLDDCITRAKSIIDRITGQTFEASASATRYYTPGVDTDGLTLYLNYPLLTLTTLTNGDSAVIASTDYKLYPLNETPKYEVRLLASKGLTWTYTTDPEGAISVVGTWGLYTTAPADIEQAALRLAAYLYKQRDAQVFDQVGVSELGELHLAAKVPSDVMGYLRPYRNLL